MKRSEINTAIEEAIRLLDKYSFTLPRFVLCNEYERLVPRG